MRTLRTWIFILALIASGAGAAAGTVLSGYVQGEVRVAVGQPLQVEKPSVSGIPSGRAWFGAVSDRSTEFSAAAALYQGEDAIIEVPIVNRADVDHIIEITVTAPDLPVPQGASPGDYSISLEVDGSGIVNDVVRIGPNRWKGTLDYDAGGRSNPSPRVAPNPFDGLKITLALGDLLPPGYYEVSGEVHVIAY